MWRPFLYRALFACLPKRILSRVVGQLASASVPRWLLHPIIRAYAGWFRIVLSQFEAPPPSGWGSFNAFFTRAFYPQARKFAAPPALSAPCDGRIIQCGTIKEGRFLQIKNQSCPLGGLWGEDLLADVPAAATFENGTFLSIYLSPRNYHRFHLPCSANMRWRAHLPGDLWSVSSLGLRAVPGLFLRNERLACGMQSRFGQWVFIAIAATGVGNIQLAAPSTPTNRPFAKPSFQYFSSAHSFKHGQELGRFLLGSSLVLVFPADTIRISSHLHPGDPLRLGEEIGRIL